MNLLELLTLITVYALVDSVDPCIYSIMATVLASSMFTSTRHVVKTGVVFISSVYVGYVVFGILLRYLLLRLPIEILACTLLIYALINLLYVILEKTRSRDELVCREEDFTCRVMSFLRLRVFVKMGLPFIFILGLISSFTLLPCSSGLYITYITITRTLGFYAWLVFTFFYVAIFISPLVLILFAFLSISKLSRVHRVFLRYEYLFRVIGSIMMISTSMYILVEYVVISGFN